MSNKVNTNQLAIEIFQLTNDGDDLIPLHLKLVEDTVNGFSDEEGFKRFQELHQTVRVGYIESRSKTIAKLNDELRTTFNSSRGQILTTNGINTLPEVDRAKIFSLVKNFNSFSTNNNPYGERDFGKVTHKGEDVFWKIDYYDTNLRYGSENPADAQITKRVMTIMLANEY